MLFDTCTHLLPVSEVSLEVQNIASKKGGERVRQLRFERALTGVVRSMSIQLIPHTWCQWTDRNHWKSSAEDVELEGLANLSALQTSGLVERRKSHGQLCHEFTLL